MLIHLEKLGKSFGEKIVLHDVTASVEREDRIGIVGQNGAGKTTLLKILTGEYQDYEGEFSVTHGVTLGYLEQNAKLDATLDLYGEMRSTFAPVLDAMAQMQVLERKMAAQPDDTELLARHDQLQNIVDAADGYNMDVNIKKVLSGMGFAQDTWQKNIAVLSGGELTRLRLAKLLLEKPDVLILDEPTNHLDFATMEWLENYLKSYSGAVLVVSHDRYFLDNVCTKIWEVSFQTMTTYKGNFSAYLPQKEAADALRQKQHDADVALAEKLQDYVDRNLVRASTTKMAQSRRRQMDKLESENTRLTAAEKFAEDQRKAAQRQVEIDRIHAEWDREAQQLKAQYPEFDLEQTLANPEIANLMRLGVSMSNAYRAVYFDQIMAQNESRTAKQVEDGVTERIRQRSARPGENGTRPGGAAQTHTDVNALTRKEREQLERAALRGQVVTF